MFIFLDKFIFLVYNIKMFEEMIDMIKYMPVEYEFLGDTIDNLSCELDDFLTIRDDRNVIYILVI